MSDTHLRDTRFAFLENVIAIEAELRDNRTIRSLFAALEVDASRAMDELSEVSPLDHAAVSKLLVRVSTLVYIRRTLDTLIKRGQAVEQSIRAEDESHGMNDEGAAGYNE